MKKLFAICVVLGLFSAATVMAFEEKLKEYPIGTGKVVSNMKLDAVYLKPVDMEPRGTDLPASKADVHLELDIHATKGNLNGFGAGEWIPYLTVGYTLANTNTGETKSGKLMPMVAKDGPHYGSNVKMMGAGNYKLTCTVESPLKQGFGRHTDIATGVGKWFQPITVEYTFKYVPIKE